MMNVFLEEDSMKSISYIMCILVILYAMTGCKLADNGLSGDISNGSGGGVTEPAADPVPVVVERMFFSYFKTIRLKSMSINFITIARRQQHLV